MPFPNDLYRDPATGLNSRVPGDGDPIVSLRTLRGFSTAGNIIIPFDGQVAGGSVNPSTVLLVQAGDPSPVPVNITVANPEAPGSSGNSTVILQPVRPLKPETTYDVVLTSAIRAGGTPIGTSRSGELTRSVNPLVDEKGHSLVPGVNDTQAAQLEPVRLAYQPVWSRAEQITGQARQGIPFAFRFSTQPLFSTLLALRAPQASELRGAQLVAGTGANVTVPEFFAAQDKRYHKAEFGSIGRIYVGSMTAPDYIVPATGFFTDPLTKQRDLNVTFIACLPVELVNGNVPAVIFQHGLGEDKRDVYLVADKLCHAGLPVIAIDLYWHGDLNPTDGLLPSVLGFFQQLNLRAIRDNTRQSISDLFVLSETIVAGNTDLNGDGEAEFTATQPQFFALSLGGMVGVAYTAVSPRGGLAALSVAGARVPDLMLNSTGLGPIFRLLVGVFPLSLQPGTDAFQYYCAIFQTIVDDVDPINYAAAVVDGRFKAPGQSSRLLLQEMVGDKSMPNSATRDHARAGGYPQVQPIQAPVEGLTQVAPPYAGTGYFQFPPGLAHEAVLGNGGGPVYTVRDQIVHFLTTGEIVNTVP